MTKGRDNARDFFASELQFTTAMRSTRLKAAFATVPREDFVGPGPWRVKSPWDLSRYWTTADADPCNVYHDVLIALDEAQNINNGQPSLWAYLLDRLDIGSGEDIIHLGCGTGYYTAIMAEVTGPSGTVMALERQEALVERAQIALAPWPTVQVSHADGAQTPLPQADVIVASAGATHPLPAWLAAIRVGGRLLLPMTANRGTGGMLLATRRTQTTFAARFLSQVGFIHFTGARNDDIGQRLEAGLRRDRGESVSSLRCDAHSQDETCWLHGDGWCLSRKTADDLVAD